MGRPNIHVFLLFTTCFKQYLIILCIPYCSTSQHLHYSFTCQPALFHVGEVHCANVLVWDFFLFWHLQLTLNKFYLILVTSLRCQSWELNIRILVLQRLFTTRKDGYLKVTRRFNCKHHLSRIFLSYLTSCSLSVSNANWSLWCDMASGNTSNTLLNERNKLT